MRPAKASIDLDALRHNLALAARSAPESRNIAVIKANGYGHGMVEAARALQGLANGLAVATMDEAMTLRDADIEGPVLVLQGANTVGDIAEAAARSLWLMVHEPRQLEWLGSHAGPPVGAWLKIDTGMHRLGFSPSDAPRVIDRLLASEAVDVAPVLCTHLACADELENPETPQQIEAFHLVSGERGLPTSIANSAGILHWPAAHADWNRPGIMLYGCDPTGSFDGDTELEPVMTVS